jgi:hypothetical protein
MCHDHRVDQADPTREPRRQQRRDASQHVWREEQDAERLWIDAESAIEPVRGAALDDEAASERIEREER